MSATPRRQPDRRRIRHAAARQEILDVAWDMVRAEGLASLSLRALARVVGMEPQSLYTYFPSKHAVYDAMFAAGNRELLRRLEQTPWPTEPRALLLVLGEVVLRFDIEDDARSQLLFDRVIPGFEPSDESYAVAVQALDLVRARLDAAGFADDTSLDLFTALTAGLATQQRANQPGGDRYVRLLDEVVDMFLDNAVKRGVLSL